MKRPFGVTVIAIFALIGGLLGLCLPSLTLMGSTLFSGILGSVGVAASIFLFVGPILQLVFAFGAFKLSSWAWVLGLISTGITVLGVVVSLFNGASFWSAIWGSIVPVIIFIYLLTPKVRQAFGQAPEQPAPVATPTPPDVDQPQ